MAFTELPKHWEVKKLGDTCKKISLNGIKIKQKEYLESGKYPVIDQGQELIGGYFDDESLLVPDEPPYIIFGDHTKVKKFVPFKFIAGADGVKVLKPHAIYEPKFYFYLLHVVKIPDKGYARHFQFLEKAEIPLPPLAEQQRIVAKLEALFSELDAGLASLNTAAQQLKTYRQAVLKWAFEGKLTNDHVTEGALPAGWKWVKVSEIAEVRLGRQRSPQKAFGENMCQYLRAANVTWDGLDLSDVKSMDFSPKEQAIYQLQKGDILLSEASGSVSEVGKPAIWNEQITNCCFQNTLIRVRPGNLAGSKFLHLRFYFDAKVGNFREIAKGVGIHHLGAAGMSNWSIALPSLEEQHRIVQEIESRLSVCDKLEETLTAARKQAEALRQSILKQAFAGKLVAPE